MPLVLIKKHFVNIWLSYAETTVNYTRYALFIHVIPRKEPAINFSFETGFLQFRVLKIFSHFQSLTSKLPPPLTIVQFDEVGLNASTIRDTTGGAPTSFCPRDSMFFRVLFSHSSASFASFKIRGTLCIRVSTLDP